MGKTEINNTAIINQHATKRQLIQIMAQQSPQTVVQQTLFCLYVWGIKCAFYFWKDKNYIYSAREYTIYLLLSAAFTTFLNKIVSRQSTKTCTLAAFVCSMHQMVCRCAVCTMFETRLESTPYNDLINKWIYFSSCFRLTEKQLILLALSIFTSISSSLEIAETKVKYKHNRENRSVHIDRVWVAHC